MSRVSELREQISIGKYDKAFTSLYGASETARSRYTEIVDIYLEKYGDGDDACLVSVPGRTEICGNHTDHNNGKVAAASVNIDIIAVAAKNNDNTIRVSSVGHDENIVSLKELYPKENERDSSTSIVRGIARAFADRNERISGINAVTRSQVLKGSGLSSSAAFEVCIAKLFSVLFCDDRIPSIELAQIGKYAENVFYGKPCGLLDQTACATGGFVSLDFHDPKHPSVVSLELDLNDAGLALCVINTGGSHSDLTDDYASIPQEMKSVADVLGHEVLGEVNEKEFFSSITKVRQKTGDRAVLRAIHFFAENHRVEKLINAVETHDYDCFLTLVEDSGRSSYMFNQNAYSPSHPEQQGISLAYAVVERALSGKRGAPRLQGGGFAGTLQAFVSIKDLEEFVTATESVFGIGSCRALSIRKYGAVSLDTIN